MYESKKSFEMTDNIKVLVVDKDENMLEICRDILEDEGYIVQTTSSINGFIASLLNKELPEILLLDLEMPGIDYLTFLHELRQVALNCCIIGIGVRESPTLAEIAIQQEEICDYLMKPYSIEQLQRSIYRCLKHLRLMKREEQFDARVEMAKNYLRSVANNLVQSTVFIYGKSIVKKDRREEHEGRKETTSARSHPENRGRD